jgi:p-cumate 2,3-dioxygenase beta subunit
MAAGVSVRRAEAEDFLYDEAAVLDAWDLERWLELFLPDGRYEIPTPDAGDLPSSSAQYFVADDIELLGARVDRLQSRNAHAEQPRSVTHRAITNVRVSESDDGRGLARVQASFAVQRVRDGHIDPYLGWYDHLLARTSDGLRFARRRSVLAGDQLRPGSRLSFIL